MLSNENLQFARKCTEYYLHNAKQTKDAWNTVKLHIYQQIKDEDQRQAIVQYVRRYRDETEKTLPPSRTAASSAVTTTTEHRTQPMCDKQKKTTFAENHDTYTSAPDCEESDDDTTSESSSEEDQSDDADDGFLCAVEEVDDAEDEEIKTMLSMAPVVDVTKDICTTDQCLIREQQALLLTPDLSETDRTQVLKNIRYLQLRLELLGLMQR
jgi:hypothetical protein